MCPCRNQVLRRGHDVLLWPTLATPCQRLEGGVQNGAASWLRVCSSGEQRRHDRLRAQVRRCRQRRPACQRDAALCILVPEYALEDLFANWLLASLNRQAHVGKCAHQARVATNRRPVP